MLTTLLIPHYVAAMALALACDGVACSLKSVRNEMADSIAQKMAKTSEQDDADYKTSFYNLNERFNELAIRYQQQGKNHELHLKELDDIKYRFKQIQEAIAEITGDKIPEYDDY